MEKNVAGLENNIAIVQDSLKQEQENYKMLEERSIKETEQLKEKMIKDGEIDGEENISKLSAEDISG